jgi:hypothetical protein
MTSPDPLASGATVTCGRNPKGFQVGGLDALTAVVVSGANIDGAFTASTIGVRGTIRNRMIDVQATDSEKPEANSGSTPMVASRVTCPRCRKGSVCRRGGSPRENRECRKRCPEDAIPARQTSPDKGIRA